MDEQKRPFRENVEHIYEYYRFHILFAIVSILVIAYLTHTFIDNRKAQAELANLPPAAVTTMFFGNVPALLEEEPLEQYKLELFPDWERVNVMVAYGPKEFKSDLDVAFLQRSVTMLQTQYADLYVMDEEDFHIYSSIGLFMPLDDVQRTYFNEVSEDRLEYAIHEDREIEELFGINITGSPWFTDTLISNEDNFIIAVRKEVENEDNAFQLVQKLAEDLQ